MSASNPAIAQTLLQIECATRVFHMGEMQVKALVDVDLTIGAGEFLTILGPSGSGKSTLLNLTGLHTVM